MFSKFDETWLKYLSKPKNLCGKFGKRNNNYKFVYKGKQTCFNKTVHNSYILNVFRIRWNLT